MDTLLLAVQDLAIDHIAPKHSDDPDFNQLRTCINTFLISWANAIPQEKLSLLGPRLQTIKDVLVKHTFEILFIWNQPPVEPELCIQYTHKHAPLLRVSLTPRHLLFQDLQAPHKEIAFPVTWF
jgi:hypothetical protein